MRLTTLRGIAFKAVVYAVTGRPHTCEDKPDSDCFPENVLTTLNHKYTIILALKRIEC